MTNFIFKSTAADLQKIRQSLEIVQKNVLYLTYRMDTVLKYLSTEKSDTRLQTQVDDFYETSHQTDSVEQDGINSS